ncbi:hypothetical protein DMB44_03825 [Thermoplasma sp. Kam2015]|uniref:outer membrane protein assembly factor BamB family protein n=1 Tax=Thermoplasma sp. Kam2015 TaxID=2094122 RepID=UPI000D92ADE6|nr:PQQ-binding-like beta-propeller repeat protein [Thermoplasma sp. Kam2015]PYB68479.1 hypothetical protein DMB44_03825 [Thermoplasma sp. Kam2015]
MKKSIPNILVIVIAIIVAISAFFVGFYVHQPTTNKSEAYVVHMDGIAIYDTYYPSNLSGLQKIGPTSWTQYADNQSRNPVFNSDLSAKWLITQYQNFSNISAFMTDFKNLGYGWITGYAQMTGDVVGPSLVNGIVYVTSSMGMLYAINAATGGVIFMLSVPSSSFMSEALIYNGIGYIGLGSAFFTYGQGLLNAVGGGHRGMYTGITGVLAFNATNGKPIWFYMTKSQAMPTGLIANNTLYWDDGDGNVYAFNLTTGSIIHRFYFDGSANMASLAYYSGKPDLIIAGFSPGYPVNMSALVELNLNLTPYRIIDVPFGATSGVGDAVPAVYGNYLVDSFTGYPVYEGPELTQIMVKQVFMVANVLTGKIIYDENLTGFYHVGGTNNGNSPLVINGTAYVPSIIDHAVFAVNISTGKILWKSASLNQYAFLHDQPTFYKGDLLVPDLNSITVLNSSNGNIIDNYTTPYIYAIQQPLVIGNTMIESSIMNYVYAAPLNNVMD